MSELNFPERISLAGLRVDDINMQELHAYIESTVSEGKKANILHLNIHGACLAWREKWLMDFMGSAQLVFCDGDGIRWALKLLGQPVPPKITYDRWVWQLCEFAASKGFSFYFLGGKPGVGKEASERLKNRYPSLKIAGEHHGHFDHQGPENQKIVDEINRLKPDIIIVGFGMPLQEKWLLENRDRVDARVFLTGGAVFDYAAGKFKRAPEWMIKSHLEWLFRMLYDPKRLFKRYVMEIPYFFYRIFKEKLRLK